MFNTNSENVTRLTFIQWVLVYYKFSNTVVLEFGSYITILTWATVMHANFNNLLHKALHWFRDGGDANGVQGVYGAEHSLNIWNGPTFNVFFTTLWLSPRVVANLQDIQQAPCGHALKWLRSCVYVCSLTDNRPIFYYGTYDAGWYRYLWGRNMWF